MEAAPIPAPYVTKIGFADGWGSYPGPVYGTEVLSTHRSFRSARNAAWKVSKQGQYPSGAVMAAENGAWEVRGASHVFSGYSSPDMWHSKGPMRALIGRYRPGILHGQWYDMRKNQEYGFGLKIYSGRVGEATKGLLAGAALLTAGYIVYCHTDDWARKRA